MCLYDKIYFFDHPHCLHATLYRNLLTFRSSYRVIGQDGFLSENSFSSGIMTQTIPNTDITPTTFSTAGVTTGIAVVVTGTIAFVVGALAGVLLYHFISKHRSQHKPVPTSQPQQQKDSGVEADPMYEVPVTSGAGTEPRENVAYEPVERIELNKNMAYSPVQH